MKLITLLFLLASFIVSNAQPDHFDLKRKYETETIYFSGRRYIKNETSYPIRNLRNEFNGSKEGQLMYQMSKSDKRKFFLCYFVTLTAIAVSGSTSNQNNNLSEGLLIGAMIPLGLSFHFSMRSVNKLQKAIWLRNRDVLLQKN